MGVELRASEALELLAGLWVLTTPTREGRESWVPESLDAAPRRVRDAIAAVGDESGELWLHLLGIALELRSGTAAELAQTVAATSPKELRRHLVGAYVPAWNAVMGADTLTAAAAGDRSAIDALFASDRYYAGRSRQALGALLDVSPAEGRKRVVAVLERFAQDVLAPHADEVSQALTAEAARRARDLSGSSPADAVAAVTSGFTYEAEAEARRLVLVPHVAARPWLLLCQHLDARIICYPLPDAATSEEALREQTLALGRALGDPARVAMLRRLAGGETGLTELAGVAGVARSTAHHHLALLRAAGLLEVRGNARAYVYSLAADGFAAAGGVLRDLAATSGRGE
jgi:DNA-binding transcriptional ArsR family regulator